MCSHVHNILTALKQERFIPLFDEHALTAEQLRDSLTDELMRELGLPLGPRLRLLDWRARVAADPGLFYEHMPKAQAKREEQADPQVNREADSDGSDSSGDGSPASSSSESEFAPVTSDQPFVSRFVNIVLSVPGKTMHCDVAVRLFSAETGWTPTKAFGPSWRRVLRADGRTFFVGVMVTCFRQRHVSPQQVRDRVLNSFCYTVAHSCVPPAQAAAVYHTLGVCQVCAHGPNCRNRAVNACSFCHEDVCVKRAK